MAEYLIQDTTLDAIAGAINAKTGGSSAMTPAQMVTAIGSIPSGGSVTQGLVDLSFNFDDGTVTASGSVSNNTVSNLSASSSYFATPLLLRQPITINNGDVIEISFENCVSDGFYTDIGLINTFYNMGTAGAQKIPVASNVSFPTRGNRSYTLNYSGVTTIVNAFYLYKRMGNVNMNASFAIHLKINNVVVF